MIVQQCRGICAIIAVISGCSQPKAPTVRFEVRGFQTKAEDRTSFTSFVHTATVVAHGDSAEAQRPYTVLFKIHRVGGGDPEEPRATEDGYQAALVIDGVGELSIPAGMRDKETSYQKAESWVPERIQLTQIAYFPWIPAKK